MRIIHAAALVMSLLGLAHARAQTFTYTTAFTFTTTFTYTTLEAPGHTVTVTSGRPDALNDQDQVVGTTRDGKGRPEGFLWQSGSFTFYPQALRLTAINDNGLAVGFGPAPEFILTIDTVTGEANTFPTGSGVTLTDINDVGAITGQQQHDSTVLGFVLQDGTRMRVMVPGSDVKDGGTFPTAIDASGQVTGYFEAPGQGEPGFIETNGHYTILNVPGSANTIPDFITASGVVGGSYTSDALLAPVGFIFLSGKYYAFLPPGAFSSGVTGIGPGGEVVGSYLDAQIKQHGFIYRNPNFHQIDVPGAAGTIISGVNAKGSLIGSYYDSDGRQHTYIAQCPEGGTCTE